MLHKYANVSILPFKMEYECQAHPSWKEDEQTKCKAKLLWRHQLIEVERSHVKFEVHRIVFSHVPNDNIYNSICLAILLKTRFAAMRRAALVSQNKNIGDWWEIPNS